MEFVNLNSLQNRSSYPLITQSMVYENNIAILPENLEIKLMKELKQIEENIQLSNTHLKNFSWFRNIILNKIMN